jgi:ankyrin repeat protein
VLRVVRKHNNCHSHSQRSRTLGLALLLERRFAYLYRGHMRRFKGAYMLNTDLACVLLAACRTGHLGTIQVCLEAGADVNAKSEAGEHPLHAVLAVHMNAVYECAWHGGEVECLQVLIEAKAEGEPLIRAYVRGNGRQVTMLLEHKADANASNARGHALHRAMGHPECVRVLLRHGADMHVADAKHRTPTALGVCQGHAECAQMLIYEPVYASVPRRSSREVPWLEQWLCKGCVVGCRRPWGVPPGDVLAPPAVRSAARLGHTHQDTRLHRGPSRRAEPRAV